MSIRFGSLTWWNWGPFAVQASRTLHYFVYFAVGVCLGAFGTETEIFERTGRGAQMVALVYRLRCDVHVYDCVGPNRARNRRQDRVRMRVRSIKSVRDGSSSGLRAPGDGRIV